MSRIRTLQETDFLKYFRQIDKRPFRKILSHYRSPGPIGYATSLVLARILKVKERISSDRELSEKLSLRQDVIGSLVQDFVDHNRAKLSELEGKKYEILKKIELLGKEKEKLLKWLLKNSLTQQAVNYVNAQVDEYSEKEKDLQEQLWEIEDEINSIQIENYNVQGLCDYLKEFVKTFNGDLDFGERKLLIESLVNKVAIGKNKKVVVELQPPLRSLGFLSPSLALRGRVSSP